MWNQFALAIHSSQSLVGERGDDGDDGDGCIDYYDNGGGENRDAVIRLMVSM